MLIHLIEPSCFRYIRINLATNRVHLLVPFIAGQDISTDNTCKSKVELKAFFEGGAVSELESYKNALEFHILLLEEGALRQAKEARLAQIIMYIQTVIDMRNSYKGVISHVLSQPSNLYSIQLRPLVQDSLSRVVNPVFTINRSNSPLYDNMHEIFPTLRLGIPDPHSRLITAVLSALPEHASFEDIQRVLAEQCQTIFSMPVDFKSYITHTPDMPRGKQSVNKAHINALMGFDEDVTSRDYIDALLGICAPNLWTTLLGSPFYLGVYANQAEKTECLSMMIQFYLGVMNVHCRAKGLSDKNFGVILDDYPALSKALIETVSQTFRCGDDMDDAFVAFFNTHREAFKLSRDSSVADKDAIQQKFEITYRTVTGTKENPHMDDFMLLDTQPRGEKQPFFTYQGLICTDFANIAPSIGPNQSYFDAVREEATIHPEMTPLQAAPTITIDIELEALMVKLCDVPWRLHIYVLNVCRASPTFQVRLFLDDVAKGKQDEANAILAACRDIQMLLRTSDKFTDYSGRKYNCTAYEYAWWAKDTHMRRMLESHMDDETKTLMLEKIDEIERSGLAYCQHGVDYKNPHYDISFVLKDLNAEEFRQLRAMVGQNNSKIRQATADNCQTIPFTATEYETLKKELEKHKPWRIASFFCTSPATAISNKLVFDFHSLITALEIYVSDYVINNHLWTYHERKRARLEIGKAQRDVPAHIAHEYCRAGRSFYPCPKFNEKLLLRILTIDNNVMNVKSWFPLSSSSSGLGFDFSLFRGQRRYAGRTTMLEELRFDLTAVNHLDEVRIADLSQSREILEMALPKRTCVL